MQAVQNAVDYRGEQYSCDHQKDSARIERENPGEQLAAVGVQRIDRTHAAQQHGGIDERITPGEVLEMLVPPHATDQRYRDEYHRGRKMIRHPKRETPRRERSRVSIFAHRDEL